MSTDTAESLVSRRVAVGFPEQRLGYVAEEVKQIGAEYCVVLDPKTSHMLGLVAFSDLAAFPEIASRIFVDLMQPPPAFQVRVSDSAESVRKIFQKSGLQPVTVLADHSDAFVGLITPESFCQYLIKRGQ